MPARFTRPARVPPRALLGFLLLTILDLSTATAFAGESGTVPWRNDLATAQAEARARNLPLWIQFTGPWCIYCKKMDMFPFADPAVVARAQTRFVPVKVRSDAYQDVVAQFNITSLPATVILSPSGRLILAQSQGYSDAPEFAGILDGAWTNALDDPAILAMEGYCPVKLVEGKGRVKGNPRLAVFHDGHAYRFADISSRDTFLKDPEHYLPTSNGLCVVSLKDTKKPAVGDPKFGATYHGRLYLFADEPSRLKFAAAPDLYSNIDIADNGTCPHCKTTEKKPVAGKSEFTATHSGKRYLFPDDTHRQAFRAAPERYLR